MRHATKTDARRMIFRVAALAALIALAGPAWAQRSGQCIKASVPEALVLPDGSAHAAGTIRICLAQKMSPVAGLHEIHVDGQAVGIYVSRVGTSEGQPRDGQPFMLFARTAQGSWILEAYAIPRGEQMVTFRLDAASTKLRRRRSIAQGSNEQVVLLAANAN